MTYTSEKCDLLGLADQKEILDEIGKDVGFESNQSRNENQSEEPILEEMKEENQSEEIEDEAPITPNNDAEKVVYSSIQDVPDDIQVDNGYDMLLYLLHNDIAIHDDYWSSFGLPIYDSS